MLILLMNCKDAVLFGEVNQPDLQLITRYDISSLPYALFRNSFN